MFLLGLVFIMFVFIFVRLSVLVFGCILVLTVLVNWFRVWHFFLGSIGLCIYNKIMKIYYYTLLKIPKQKFVKQLQVQSLMKEHMHVCTMTENKQKLLDKIPQQMEIIQGLILLIHVNFQYMLICLVCQCKRHLSENSFEADGHAWHDDQTCTCLFGFLFSWLQCTS